jgi:uncharacterized membrane protein YeaQ/YmgE (transglycosylase-associated protein family)
MINLIVWFIAGAGLGSLASLVMRSNAQQTFHLNLVVGIAGACIAGLVLTPRLGISTLNQSAFSLPALLVSLVGGMTMLAVVNLIRHTTPPQR